MTSMRPIFTCRPLGSTLEPVSPYLRWVCSEECQVGRTTGERCPSRSHEYNQLTTVESPLGIAFAAAWARIALIDVNIRRPPPKRRGQGEYEEFGSDCCSPSDAGPLLREKGVIKGSVLSGWQARLATKLFAWDAFRRSLVALK